MMTHEDFFKNENVLKKKVKSVTVKVFVTEENIVQFNGARA